MDRLNNKGRRRGEKCCPKKGIVSVLKRSVCMGPNGLV